MKIPDLRPLAIALSAFILAATVEAGVRPPNILFILSDDHASHAISAYGSRINQTPNLDRLAREGMRFDRCLCVNSICAPSRAAILTGRYGHLNGVDDNTTVFDGSQPTLPKLLRQAGYHTALIGKWHLKSTPTGFDHFDILPGQGEYHDPRMIRNGGNRRLKGYLTDLITELALDWLKARESSEQPFFLMLHHKAPHANWESDKKHDNLFANQPVPLHDTFDDDHRTRTAQIANHRLKVGPKQWDLHFKRFGPLPEGLDEQAAREWVYQAYMKNYLRCVASVDDNVGRVLDYLDRTRQAANTLVIYTSDQGFFLGDHGLYDKRFMYEPALRMPLLMRYPDHIEPGSSSVRMVLNIDFAPTLLDFAGQPVPEDMQGGSFKEIASGGSPPDWRTAMYYRFTERMFGVGPHEGIRTDRYKLIHFQYGDGGWELYDLKSDPDELNNLHRSPDHRELRVGLKARLAALRQRYKVPETAKTEPSPRDS